MRIRLLVLKGAPASVVTGLYESLSLAMGIAQCAGEIEIVSESDEVIPCAMGFELKSNASIEDEAACLQSSDVLLIGPLGSPPKEGFGFDPTLLRWIAQHGESGALVVSVCTGAFLLAASGLLNNKIATTHWRFEESFRRTFPEVRLQCDRMVVEDGNVMTSGGAMAYQDLSLRLIERLFGQPVSLRCAKLLMLSPDRQSQAEFADYQRFKQHSDQKVAQAQTWIEENYYVPISVRQLADQSCLSERHFKRRFKEATGEAPSHYWQRVRIDRAKNAVATSNDAIELIGQQVGYEDSRFFRTLFKRYTNLTPIEYRKRFGFVR